MTWGILLCKLDINIIVHLMNAIILLIDIAKNCDNWSSFEILLVFVSYNI